MNKRIFRKSGLVVLIVLVLGCLGFKAVETATSSAAPTKAKSVRVPSSFEELTYLQEDTDVSPILFTKRHKLKAWTQELKSTTGFYSNSEVSPVAELISKARVSVDIEIYEMSNLSTRNAIREALAKKVRVRVIKEPKTIGQTCNLFFDGVTLYDRQAKVKPAGMGAREQFNPDCIDQVKLVQEIRSSAGGVFIPFNKEEHCGQEKKIGMCYQHGKLVIIDNTVALVSTGNFNSSNLCDLKENPKVCNRDYTYISSDTKVVSFLTQVFESDLKNERYDLEDLIDQAGVRHKVTVSPFSFEPIEEFLRSAKKSIRIQNQYINDPELVELLIEIAQDKKSDPAFSIKIQLEDACNYGSIAATLKEKTYRNLNRMARAGIKLTMFNKHRKLSGKPGYLHAKAIVIDDTRAWLGSVNGSDGSLNKNREFGLFFRNKNRVQALSSLMDEDFRSRTNKTWVKSVRDCPVKVKKPKVEKYFDDDDSEAED